MGKRYKIVLSDNTRDYSIIPLTHDTTNIVPLTYDQTGVIPLTVGDEGIIPLTIESPFDHVTWDKTVDEYNRRIQYDLQIIGAPVDSIERDK